MARGLTLERSTLKVLRAVAQLEDVSPSELLQQLVVAAFAGRAHFSPDCLATIARLRSVYECPDADTSLLDHNKGQQV